MNRHLALVLSQVENKSSFSLPLQQQQQQHQQPNAHALEGFDQYDARFAERRRLLTQEKSVLLLNRVMPFNVLGYTALCLLVEGTKPYRIVLGALCTSLFPKHAATWGVAGKGAATATAAAK